MEANIYKSFNRTIVLLFCCVSSSTMTAQWTSKTPQIDDTVSISRSQVINANTIWMGAEHVFFDPDSNQVWGDFVSMYSSADGGTTWKYKRFDTDTGEYPFLSAVTGIDGMNGWAGIFLSGSASNLILKTTDGGINWTPTATNTFLRPESFVDVITFKDALNGIMVGDPSPETDTSVAYFEIYRTTDGGNTWARIQRSKIPDPLASEYGSAGDYARMGDTIWFSTTRGRIFKSIDDGQNWQVYRSGSGYSGFLHFNDPLHGICTSLDTLISTTGSSEIKYTEDGGLTWQYVKSPFVDSTYFWSVCLIPVSNYVLTNHAATLQGAPFTTLLSKDKGQTWTVIGQGDGLSCAKFISPSIGFAGDGVSLGQNHGTKLFKYAGNPLVGLLTATALKAEFILYPNPVQDKITVDVKLEQASSLLILINTMDGKLVLSRTITDATNAHHEELDLKSLEPGTYIITISSPEGHLNKTFIKQ